MIEDDDKAAIGPKGVALAEALGRGSRTNRAMIFARRDGSGFVGIARCECGVEYTSDRVRVAELAVARAAKCATDDGWDAALPDKVECPWCLESRGEWPDDTGKTP